MGLLKISNKNDYSTNSEILKEALTRKISFIYGDKIVSGELCMVGESLSPFRKLPVITLIVERPLLEINGKPKHFYTGGIKVTEHNWLNNEKIRYIEIDEE